jgi:hypothetical protein
LGHSKTSDGDLDCPEQIVVVGAEETKKKTPKLLEHAFHFPVEGEALACLPGLQLAARIGNRCLWLKKSLCFFCSARSICVLNFRRRWQNGAETGACVCVVVLSGGRYVARRVSA